ncbi:MAG: sensor hybrid histidine kinase [Ramlibacter sp.]|nr:sensor hybrid histidine kinase [Ramlibacter sp.]
MSSRERLRRLIIAAGALVAANIALAVACDGWRLHQQLLAANEREMRNLAAALASGTARSVQAADVLLRDTAAWYEAGGRFEDEAAIHAGLAARSLEVPQLNSITIVDRSGLQRYRSDAAAEALGDVSGRGYFVRQRDQPDAGFVIQSVPTRSGRTPALILSRALRRPDGSFDGVVSAILTLRELQGGAVTRDERDVLAPWHDEMAIAGVRAATALLAVLFTVVAVLHQLRRIDAGEQALRESQERYALAMDAADEGCIEWVIPAGPAFVSSKWRWLHGLDEHHPLGTIEDLKRSVRLHAEDVKAVCVAIDRHLEGGTPGVDVEYRVLHPDGSWKWVHSRGRCFRHGQNAPLRLFLASHGIDARKEAEASRSALQMRTQEDRRMEALGTLAGGIAHDFNNLLGAILGFAGMARQLVEEGSPVRRHIDRVLQAASRARSIVQRLLQFSRSGETGKSPVNFQRVVEEVVVIHSPALPAGVSVETRLHAPDAAVAGDAAQLYQVVANLYTNAIQAVGTAGQVRLVLRLAQVEATQALLHGELTSGRYVRLDVEDSGPGMLPDTAVRIFEPFFTTRGPGEGTGLGLWVVHGIVSDAAGAIDVQSGAGAGTRISVWLPVAAPGDPARTEPPATHRGQGELILVVDDEPLLVELAVEQLTELGYAALAYTSSREALQAFLDAPAKVDLVLTDEKMPELSGSELVAAIRARGYDLPVIIMSGNVTAGLEERARALGIGELLRKPLSDEAMAAALARWVRPKSRP